MHWLLWPLTAAFLCISAGLAGEELRLPPGAPVFTELSVTSPLLTLLPEGGVFEVTEKPHRIWFPHHPLLQYVDYYRISVNGQPGYVSPDLFTDDSSGKLIFRISKDAPLAGRLLLPVSLGILFFLLFHLYRVPEARGQWWYYAGIAVAVRVALLSYVVSISGNILCNPADEPGYFEVGYDILHGDFTGPWRYPVGHGVLTMLPAIVLCGAETYWDLAIPLSWYGGFVLGPLALVLALRILLALKISLKTAFSAVLAWAVLPFFLHHVPDWEKLIFHSFAGWPQTGNSFRYYMELIGSGFNGMSDMGSTVLVFAVLLLALKLPPSWSGLAVISALFGWACLVRLNNVFFAPVLGMLLITGFREKLKDLRSVLSFAAAGSLPYLAVVGFQFAVNAWQFGSPWIWPYSLHALDRAVQDRPAAGFTFATLLKGQSLRYLLESNLAVMSCGIAGLMLLRERYLRAVLGLWSLPVILFFCGYSHTFCDPVRFILSAYIPLLAAAALLFSGSRKYLAGGCAAAGGLILLHSGVLLAVLLTVLLIRSIYDAAKEVLCRLKPALISGEDARKTRENC